MASTGREREMSNSVSEVDGFSCKAETLQREEVTDQSESAVRLAILTERASVGDLIDQEIYQKALFIDNLNNQIEEAHQKALCLSSLNSKIEEARAAMAVEKKTSIPQTSYYEDTASLNVPTMSQEFHSTPASGYSSKAFSNRINTPATRSLPTIPVVMPKVQVNVVTPNIIQEDVHSETSDATNSSSKMEFLMNSLSKLNTQVEALTRHVVDNNTSPVQRQNNFTPTSMLRRDNTVVPVHRIDTPAAYGTS